jgi:hypothetical protein
MGGRGFGLGRRSIPAGHGFEQASGMRRARAPSGRAPVGAARSPSNPFVIQSIAQEPFTVRCSEVSVLAREHKEILFDIPLSSGSVRRVHWKDSGGLLFWRNCRVERRSIEVPTRSRQQGEKSNDSPSLRALLCISFLLRTARSPATQTRQTPVPRTFPAVRPTPTSSVCCTGNAVRKHGESRDTQQGVPLLPWSCEKEADPVGSDRFGVFRPEPAWGQFCSPDACRARALSVCDRNRGFPPLDRRRTRNLVPRDATAPGWSHLDRSRDTTRQYPAVQGFGTFPINDLPLRRGRHAWLETDELQCRSGHYWRRPEPLA